MLASKCVSFYENIEASSKLFIRFISAEMTLTQFLTEIYFSIANDCSVNLSDLTRMLVKKTNEIF